MTAPSVATMDQLGIVELITTAATMVANGEAENALDLYQHWLRENPDDPCRHLACFNHGYLLFDCGHLAEASAAYAEAIRIEPSFLPAYVNAGLTFERLNRLDQAANHWLHVANVAAPLDSACLANKATALKNLGRIFQTAREYGRAEEIFQRCLEIDPHQSDVIQQWISLRQMQCKWPVIDPVGGLTRSILIDTLSPLALAIHSDDPMFQLANAWHHACMVGVGSSPFHTAGRWIAPAASTRPMPLAASTRPESSNASKRPSTPATNPSRPLRIGYVSPDLRGHAVGFLTVELFELHDRANIELFAYYSGQPCPDSTQHRFKQGADHWREIASLSPNQTARLIIQDGIDILVDLGGHTNGAPTAAFALRPAPVIVNWLGYPGSMGSAHHQYIIGDNEVIPTSHEKYYTERVVRLPCYQPTDRQRVVAEPPPSRAQVGLSDDAMVYCCFNGAQKITPAMFQCWMNILAQVPHAVLWLLSCDGPTDERLRQRAAGYGIAPERLVFAVRKPNDEHLARYQLADLFLDTAPYGAHTTASDSLWMGVPVLTMVGHSFPARVCASLVRAAGLEELVCDNLTAYSQMAIALGHRPDVMIGLRDRLHAGRDTCTLFDMPLLVTRLEALYQQMWDDYLSDRIPQPDLTNLGIYRAIGTELENTTANSRDLQAYEQRYRAALTYRHSITPMPPDRRLWTPADCQNRYQNKDFDTINYSCSRRFKDQGGNDSMDAHVTFLETSSPSAKNAEMVRMVRHALDQAIAGQTKLVPEILAMPGMSGRKYRCFINNLIQHLPMPHYLEVGSWAGSTLCSAVFGNDVEALAIDNWSQFGGPSDRFFAHLSQFKGNARVSFLERDFRQVDFTCLGHLAGAFNVYLFDGPHAFEDQYYGVTVAQAALAPCYVQIVDDWNWPDVRNGTMKAIADLGLSIDFMAEVRTSFDDQHASPSGPESDWHNGYFISVLSRKN